MPAAKVATKKTAKKAASKTAKRITQADIEANFDRIQKTLDEIGEAHKKVEKTLDEIGKAHKETMQAHKATEKTLDEIGAAHKATEKTLNKAIGGLSNTLGSLVEHIMTPDLPRKFRQFGFTFDRITTVKWANGEGNVYTEIDGLLENGKQALVVEVKTTLRRNDVDDHLERMERVRKYADDHEDTREFLGAMATTISDKDTKEYALSKGFFVIEPSGEDVKITKPASEPKIW